MMFYRQTLFCLLLLAWSVKAFSTVFVVTSNADSGTGTLRDALTQAAANGSAVKDSIIFNLPDVSLAGRTITLLTQLPMVSSNILIDGSTQPGANFGVSGAKVAIEAAFVATNTTTICFNFANQQDVEIDGIMLDIPAGMINTGTVYGFYGLLSKNINIGSPGKGNVIKNMGSAIYLKSNEDETNSNISENVKISSNIIGINEDGETLCTAANGSVGFERVRNLTIGGATAAEGNIFGGQCNVSEIAYTFDIETGQLSILNNYFGVDYTGTIPIYNYAQGTTVGIAAYQFTQVVISKNVFVAQSDLDIGGLNCFFKVTGNKFGTDITGLNVLGTFGLQVIVGYCNAGGIIGGTNPEDQNIFSGAYKGGQGTEQTQFGVIMNVGSPKIQVIGNSFKCNYSNYPYQLSLVGSTNYFVKINNRTNNAISGTAPPGSRVDLYYSLTCDHCEPEQIFNSVNTNANGNWSYTGTLLNNNIIASSTTDSTTSEFSTLRFSNQESNVITKSACGGSNGSITGLTTNSLAQYTWYDANGNVVGNNLNLPNVPPGTYHLIVDDGYCSISSLLYTIKDAGNQLNTSSLQIKPATCDQKDGSITGVQSDPTYSFVWKDQNGNVQGNGLDLINVSAGAYTLTATTPDGSCSQIYGPVVFINTTGPNIDQSKVAITATSCGQSVGSITNLNITGTGTIKYTWLNSQQQTVGTDSILTNQPAGTYKLEVADATQCGPVFSTDLVIPEINGITLNETGAKISVASCAQNNGSVTGITATGATQYQWSDATGNVVSSAIDLLNVASGYYVLTVSNGYGCSKTSTSYHVGQQAATQFPVYAVTIYQACTGKSNGGINVPVDTLVTLERWTNATGQTINTGIGISGVPSGVYMLYLTDKNGCEQLYGTYEIPDIPQLTINANSGQVINDQCSNKIASVKNIQVTGGRPPYTYAWLDAGNNVVSTSLNLTGVSAGTYTFTVNDATTCGIVSAVYTIQNQDNIIPAPSVSNLQVCSAGEALILVNNVVTGYSYRLYADNNTSTPLDSANNGKFKINVSANTTYYISQVSGSCESDRTAVQVSVGLSSIDIVNTFTPNGDGVNDYWKITSIENYPNALVQVFSRYGQKVFESKGYAQQFDGTQNGKRLPTGVYYYIINLQDNCTLLSGSLTLLR